MIQPQVPASPQHSIHIKQQEFERSGRNPPVYSPAAPHDVDRPVEHRQPLLQRHVERHEPSERHRLIIRRNDVQRRGHNSDIVELHPPRESPRSAADIQPEPEHRARRLGDLEQLRNGEVQFGLVSHEIGDLVAHIKTHVGVQPIQAIEALARRVPAPQDGVVEELRRKRVLRERRGGGLWWGFGEASPARERVAAAEDEGLNDVVRSRRAERESGVVHVLVEELGVVVAGGSYGGKVGVEEEIGRNRGGGGSGNGVVRRVVLVAREVVDGGAYGLELVNEVVRDVVRSRGFGVLLLNAGREVVERENVGGHHSHQEEEVQTHCETHFPSLLLQRNFSDFWV
ncbi:hypothetical protein TorRG33x02_248230 [Trema orientale]|uniref:Uncharacterized protein n=1 Tax=Trema orientale TaxID=63057 RepID=A0A2P5DL82_TREOI|nr:hypothetical protein TorRG33x02_248230 [Trema orientale]